MAYKLVIFDFDGTLADSAGWLFGVLIDPAWVVLNQAA